MQSAATGPCQKSAHVERRPKKCRVLCSLNWGLSASRLEYERGLSRLYSGAQRARAKSWSRPGGQFSPRTPPKNSNKSNYMNTLYIAWIAILSIYISQRTGHLEFQAALTFFQRSSTEQSASKVCKCKIQQVIIDLDAENSNSFFYRGNAVTLHFSDEVPNYITTKHDPRAVVLNLTRRGAS